MLSCANVSYSYGGSGAFTLRDASLAVRGGEVLGVAGRSGSGKSTLLGCLAGELVPQSGGVAADGVSTAGGGASGGRVAFRRLVGMVHQMPEEQLFARTVAEDVAFGPRNLELSDDEVESRTNWALGAVGLDPATFGPRNPFALSGGEARRVAIAGILALRPRYLLLDEPTAGLDPRERDRLLGLLSSLAGEGLGIVLVSHDVESLTRSCDRVALLSEGRVVACGPMREVLGDAALVQSAGLVPPVAVRLAERLRRRGVSVPGNVVTAAGVAAALRDGGTDT